MKNDSNKTSKHRIGLIKLYEDQIIGDGPFMTEVLRIALRELYKGVSPKKVENFVVKMEKTLRSGL
jgi:hypothetical protein